MQEIISIAEKFDIPVIEDSAEALGSSINDTKCGTFGDIGILSFNGNKIITTSGGGALVSQNQEYVKQATFLSTQARDEAPHYQHSHIGYNYRMSNICAGIGRGQMQVLQDRVQQRRANYEFYEKSLSELPGISFVKEPPGYFSNRWLTTILVNPQKTGGVTRENIRLVLESQNIESRPLWKPMHLQPIFKDYPYYGEQVSEQLFENGLCLPSGSNLTEENLDTILQSILSVLK